VPLIVAVAELTRLSSGDEEVGRLMEDLELGVSEALGISLSEVRAHYFRDSDEGEDSEDSEIERDLVEEHNYRYVIVNHIRSSQYRTHNIDGVPYASYRDDNRDLLDVYE
jgi:hypothetical protein